MVDPGEVQGMRDELVSERVQQTSHQLEGQLPQPSPLVTQLLVLGLFTEHAQ